MLYLALSISLVKTRSAKVAKRPDSNINLAGDFIQAVNENAQVAVWHAESSTCRNAVVQLLYTISYNSRREISSASVVTVHANVRSHGDSLTFTQMYSMNFRPENSGVAPLMQNPSNGYGGYMITSQVLAINYVTIDTNDHKRIGSQHGLTVMSTGSVGKCGGDMRQSVSSNNQC